MNHSALLRQATNTVEIKRQKLVSRLTQANFSLDNECSSTGMDKVTLAEGIRNMSDEQLNRAFKLLRDKKSKKGKFIDRNRW